MDRRRFLQLTAAGVGVGALGIDTGCAPIGGGSAPAGLFSLGVAAGLHGPTEIVCWTRVDPDFDDGHPIRLEVATDPGILDVVWSSTHAPGPDADHTIKVKPEGLSPDTVYWYRFREDGGAGRASPVGRARTVPSPGAAVSSLRFAFASCQCFANGWYAAWRHIATQPVDAVLFLGDYIYEAPTVQLLGVVRSEPTDTCVTLGDYRARYRLYKSDVDLQSAHAAHPFVPVWDDHEVANDYDSTVFAAEPDRVAAAYQAWFEYQPVWPVDGYRIHRSHRWGDLGHLAMLDTRQYRGVHSPGAPLIGPRALGSFEAGPDRTMLGLDQRAWLLDELDAAQADAVPWKVIGNQVLMAPIRLVDWDTPENRQLDPNLPTHAGLYSNANFDSWDGFGFERDLILAHLADAGVANTVLVTGDYHSFWAAPLTPDFDDSSAPVVAHDYAAGAISSAGGAFNENFLTGGSGSISTSPGFDYVDLIRNGYGIVEATHADLKITFYAHDAIYRNVTPVPTARFTLTPGSPDHLVELL